MPVDDLTELYGLPLDRFVPERTALARALRAAGHRDQAGQVAALRKPSVAAWAVNQLTRSQQEAIRELFTAGDELLGAHAALLEGEGDATVLRERARRERAAVDALLRAAGGLLSSDGHDLAPGTLERVAETLHAAALEPDARAQVADGRLVRELRHVGLGPTALVTTPSSVAPAPRAPARTTAGRRQADRGQRAVDERGARERAAGERAAHERAAHERAAHERARRLEEAREVEAEARRLAARAAHELEQAEARRGRAARALDEAEAALAAARARAEQAQERHRAAQQAVETS